jgi:hypothetical protein
VLDCGFGGVAEVSGEEWALGTRDFRIDIPMFEACANLAMRR